MEWERARTYILLFFVLLNILLGGLLLMERRRYTVSSTREQAIVDIMHKNNITMDTRLMRRFPPMRVITLGGFYYDVDELAEIFFGTTNVGRVPTNHGYTLAYGSGELVISHGFISYDNPYGHGDNGGIANLDRRQAQRIADVFVRAHWSDFDLDDILIAPDWIRLTYRQVYRGYMIHSNFIEIIVTETGIVQIEMQFADILEMDRERRPIAAPDEVLLTFVQRVRVVSPMTVTHIDLVYFQETGSTDPIGRYVAEPFYRIFIDGNDRDPFLINAFSNEIIN